MLVLDELRDRLGEGLRVFVRHAVGVERRVRIGADDGPEYDVVEIRERVEIAARGRADVRQADVETAAVREVNAGVGLAK